LHVIYQSTLFHNSLRPCAESKIRIIKTKLAIRGLCHVITLEHLKGDLAATTLPGDFPDLLQHFLTQAQASACTALV